MRGMSSSCCECGHGEFAVENIMGWSAVLLADHLQCGHDQVVVENENTDSLGASPLTLGQPGLRCSLASDQLVGPAD